MQSVGLFAFTLQTEQCHFGSHPCVVFCAHFLTGGGGGGGPTPSQLTCSSSLLPEGVKKWLNPYCIDVELVAFGSSHTPLYGTPAVAQVLLVQNSSKANGDCTPDASFSPHQSLPHPKSGLINTRSHRNVHVSINEVARYRTDRMLVVLIPTAPSRDGRCTTNENRRDESSMSLAEASGCRSTFCCTRDSFWFLHKPARCNGQQYTFFWSVKRR